MWLKLGSAQNGKIVSIVDRMKFFSYYYELSYERASIKLNLTSDKQAQWEGRHLESILPGFWFFSQC